jgi:hypothetical protein
MLQHQTIEACSNGGRFMGNDHQASFSQCNATSFTRNIIM